MPIPSDIQDAIIQAESSGRPSVIGDVGASAGESRGLMQIQDQTAKGLYKKGLLPEKWNGKKVKRNRLSDLLLDPEFNKLAGSALYEDNRNILKKKAIQKGINLSDAELEDLVIKSHNQGVTKTIKRDLLGEQPVNPNVQKYLDKIRGQIEPPEFDDGGLVDPIAPVEPAPQAYPETYQEMMADLDKRKAQYDVDRQQAAIGDFASQAVKAFGEYAPRKAAADVQAATGMRFDAPKVDIRATDLVGGLKQPNLQEYVQKIQLMKSLKSLKGTKDKGFTLSPGQVRYDAQGKLIVTGPAKPLKPGDAVLSRDPKSKASKASQEKLKGVGFAIADKDLKLLSQQDIEKNFGTFIRKSTTQIQQVREARLTAKQAWQVAEKDEVSDKQLESIIAIDDIQNMVKRIKELKKDVKLAKGVVGPKPRQFMTQAGAEYLGIEPDPKYAQLQALVEKQLSDYIKSASGLTVSDQEATRLSRALPTMAMPDKQFGAVMKEFEKTLREVKSTRFKNLKGYQGKIIPTETVVTRENLIKKVRAQYPKWNRDKAIRFLKSKKRW